MIDENNFFDLAVINDLITYENIQNWSKLPLVKGMITQLVVW